MLDVPMSHSDNVYCSMLMLIGDIPRQVILLIFFEDGNCVLWQSPKTGRTESPNKLSQ